MSQCVWSPCRIYFELLWVLGSLLMPVIPVGVPELLLQWWKFHKTWQRNEINSQAAGKP